MLGAGNHFFYTFIGDVAEVGNYIGGNLIRPSFQNAKALRHELPALVQTSDSFFNNVIKIFAKVGRARNFAFVFVIFISLGAFPEIIRMTARQINYRRVQFRLFNPLQLQIFIRRIFIKDIDRIIFDSPAFQVYFADFFNLIATGNDPHDTFCGKKVTNPPINRHVTIFGNETPIFFLALFLARQFFVGVKEDD